MCCVAGYFTLFPFLSTSAPPLTVDNVLTAVQGVDWRTLGEALLPYDYDWGTKVVFYRKLDEIEHQNQSDDDRLHAMVKTWVQGSGMDEEPSWRWLIWRLDHRHMTGVADTIRDFVEPVLGKSCDFISILYSV